MLLRALILIALAATSATAQTNGTGGFPVFGQSAEREAFFADQAAAREEAYRTLRTERLRAEAAEAEPEPETRRRVYPVRRYTRDYRCRVVPVETAEDPVARRPLPGREPGERTDTSPPVTEVRCTRGIVRYGLPIVVEPASRTVLGVTVGSDGVRGGLRVTRPGLDLSIGVD